MKLNVKNLIILFVGCLFLGLFMADWLVILFEGATFTVSGILLNIAKLCVAVASFMYLEDYLERK